MIRTYIIDNGVELLRAFEKIFSYERNRGVRSVRTSAASCTLFALLNCVPCESVSLSGYVDHVCGWHSHIVYAAKVFRFIYIRPSARSYVTRESPRHSIGISLTPKTTHYAKWTLLSHARTYRDENVTKAMGKCSHAKIAEYCNSYCAAAPLQ